MPNARSDWLREPGDRRRSRSPVVLGPPLDRQQHLASHQERDRIQRLAENPTDCRTHPRLDRLSASGDETASTWTRGHNMERPNRFPRMFGRSLKQNDGMALVNPLDREAVTLLESQPTGPDEGDPITYPEVLPVGADLLAEWMRSPSRFSSQS